MAKKDIQNRTLNFSIRIVKLCKFLRENGGTGYDIMSGSIGIVKG